jgi:hypothetical protein
MVEYRAKRSCAPRAGSIIAALTRSASGSPRGRSRGAMPVSMKINGMTEKWVLCEAAPGM